MTTEWLRPNERNMLLASDRTTRSTGGVDAARAQQDGRMRRIGVLVTPAQDENAGCRQYVASGLPAGPQTA